ncbi:hypothetical protein PFISCL1PPCAC_7767, partial [Pristionchus fissidentatus]
ETAFGLRETDCDCGLSHGLKEGCQSEDESYGNSINPAYSSGFHTRSGSCHSKEPEMNTSTVHAVSSSDTRLAPVIVRVAFW